MASVWFSRSILTPSLASIAWWRPSLQRRPGQSDLSTPRQEADQVTIYSGTEFGKTLGTPIMLLVNNKDQRPQDYGEMSKIPRPSHADFTYQMKYGTRASSGGGRSSARETIGRVAAGAIAEKWLQDVITSYSIHYTKLYERLKTSSCSSPGS